MPARSEQRSRKSPFFWIAIGIAALIGLLAILLTISFYIGKSNLQKNGNLGAVEKLINADPDSVVLKEDSGSGWVYYKSKSSGKLLRARLDPAAKAPQRELVQPGDPDAPDPNAPPLK